MWTSCGTQRAAAPRTSISSRADRSRTLRRTPPDFQEAGELKGDDLAKVVQILNGSGVPGSNPVQLE